MPAGFVGCVALAACIALLAMGRASIAQDLLGFKRQAALSNPLLLPDSFGSDQPDSLDDETHPLPALPPGKRAKQKLPEPPRHLKYDVEHAGAASGIVGMEAHLERNVLLTVTDVDTGQKLKLSAEVVDYNAATGEVRAAGTATSRLRFEMADGVFTGDAMEYNMQSRTGSVSNGTLESDTFRMHGESIQANADGSYSATNAMFTTCNKGSLDGSNGVPDYRVFARRILVVPGQYVSARRVTFYLGKRKTLPLPSIKRDLNTQSAVSSLPTPSFDRKNGISLHLVGTPESEKHSTFDYDVLAHLTSLPTGYLLYQTDITRRASLNLPPKGILPSLGDPLESLLQQLNPPTYRAYVEGRPYEVYPDRVTFYSILGNQQFIFNRKINDLTLSRLPEAGVHFGNILGKLSGSPEQPKTDAIGPDRIPYAPALLEAYVSMGVLHESPTGVTAFRTFSRVDYASQPLVIGRRLSWRYAATNWLNAYSQGTVYELFAPEVEMDYVPTRTSLVNVGYRYLTDAGTTPFAVDRRDIRHEFRLQYQVGGPYVFGIVARFDLEQMRAYDEQIAIVRRLDCMEYGISYQIRTQSFQVIFSLLPVHKKDKTQ